MSLTEIDSTSFYQDAWRYDLITAALAGPGPVDFYRAQAMRHGGPVLELACGTGRLVIPIAEAGVEVVGLDVCPHALSLAERKASDGGLSIAWTQADMRAFDLQRQFRCIFIASNSFSHLYSRADIEGCLACVRRHLLPSGRFVLEVFNPSLGLLARPMDQRTPVTEFDDPHSGSRVAVSKTVRYDPATQISHETWYFRDAASDQEQAVSLNLRMYFPEEIDALLHYNGFVIKRKFGDHKQTPFTDCSRSQVIVCTAADSAK